MDALFIKDLVVYSIVIVIVAYVTYMYDMWGVGKGTGKAKADTKKNTGLVKKRNKVIKRLNYLEKIANHVGLLPKDAVVKELEYKLFRLDVKIKILNRHLKVIELIGIFKVIKIVGFLLSVFGFVFTESILFLGVFVVALSSNLIFNMVADAKINDEDLDIEADFPKFYVMVCNQLYNGGYSRLTPTLDSYLKSLNDAYGDKSHLAIKRLIIDIRKNIEIYGDDSMAIIRIRDRYRSVTVINFCNLAVQSLKGVDNKDKLLAFKLELEAKQLKASEERAEAGVLRGRRCIWIIYFILGQFVVLSWIAKLGGTWLLK